MRIIDPQLLLECVGGKNQGQIGKLLGAEDVHFLLIFGCREDHRFEYLDIGPGRRVPTLGAALECPPEGHSARFLVPTRTCPTNLVPPGLPYAQAIPYALAKVVPMAPPAIARIAAKVQPVPAVTAPVPVAETPVAKPAEKPAATESSPAAASPVAPASSVPPAAPASGAVKIPVPQKVVPSLPRAAAAAPRPAPTANPFGALPDENPTDTLRRALHGVLTNITDREASLNVREASVSELDENYVARNREIQAKLDAITAREAALAETEKALAARAEELVEREKEFATRDEDLKTRRNSVSFREKSLATREQEVETRIFDINAREGALVPNERALAAREAALATREKDCKSLVDSFAAEKARMDGEMRTFYETLKTREDAVAAREKSIAAQEATFRAETAAFIRSLESMTAASRASAGR